MDAVDLAVVILVRVALKHGKHFPGRFKKMPHLGRARDGMHPRNVEPLMHEDKSTPWRALDLLFQPPSLRRWDLGVLPVEIPGVVGHAVLPIARIENDKSKARAIERVIAAVLSSFLQKLCLRKRLDAVVAKHGMKFDAALTERTEGLL